jgi:hypothetical protein
MHECMYKPWTGMGRVDGRLQHSLTAMMASRIKIRIHFVARAKRVEMLGGRRREHHHHRARSFIGLALVAFFGAWHVSVISRTPPPRAVSSSQTLVSSSHILPQHYHCHY